MSGKVVYVLVDGLRYDKARECFGYLEHLVETKRAAVYKVISELPSLSKPLYEVLLTGTPASVNGTTSNLPRGLSGQKSLFHLAGEHGLRPAAAAYYWVSELYNRSPFNPLTDREQADESMPVSYGRFYWEDRYPDSHLFADGEALRRAFDPDLLFLHPMGVDDAGERFGSGSKEYRDAVLQTGSFLARLLPEWLSAGYQAVITSDHGMTEWGNHGGSSPAEREVPLYVISPRVEPADYEEVVPQLAVAPCICRLLGIPPAASMISSILPGWKME